jgi:tRNA1Val (adenine37-N6)-methyltransferase
LPDKLPELFEGERIDLLGRQGLRIIQNPLKFKFTMDAFLLTSFIEPKPKDRIMDLGTGGGVLPLLIAGQREVQSIYGLEIQPELASMAVRSVYLNGLEAKIHIVEGDLRHPPHILKPNSFDHVITNPPFFQAGQGIISENQALARAKFEIDCTLEDVMKSAARLVRANGKVAIIYPAARLADLLFHAAKVHLSPTRLRPVYPKTGSDANLILLEARPSTKSPLEVLPPLTVYDETGEYTAEMNRIFNGERMA